MIKAIFVDIDWTLLSHEQGKVPDSAIKAIKQVQKNGVKCVAATGRSPIEFKVLNLEGVNFDGYIMLSGQIVKAQNGQYIAKRSLKNVKPIINEFNKCELPIMIMEEDKAYINFINDTVVDAMESINTPIPPVSKYDGAEVYHSVLFAEENEANKNAYKFPGFHYLRWHEKGTDITMEGIDKVLGIKEYCEHYGILQSETMSFGDSDNDLDMLKWTKIGVAMGNANDKAKALADYITKDIDDDGVAYALKHFGIF